MEPAEWQQYEAARQRCEWHPRNWLGWLLAHLRRTPDDRGGEG